MPSITILSGCIAGGVAQSTGAVVTDLSFSISSQLVRERLARWTSAAVVKPLPDVRGQVALLDEVTALTGGAPVGLDGYTVCGIPAGRMFDVKLAAENAPRRYVVIAVDGEVADGDNIISPPDYDATNNNKFLLRVQ